ncbi:hypothetical protein TNIN_10101 [Trichonephila inaurata madagascariensis]|uniref:Uncharacterized protein n=1 Tax=Trichonephila inaurata madagascariensis TaxID=2747483 RepID=A0A8X7CD19_9ARAC|nr:hypothetical protein TNIN_10101 [Trichonephila inaurata madagascariensis]
MLNIHYKELPPSKIQNTQSLQQTLTTEKIGQPRRPQSILSTTLRCPYFLHLARKTILIVLGSSGNPRGQLRQCNLATGLPLCRNHFGKTSLVRH